MRTPFGHFHSIWRPRRRISSHTPTTWLRRMLKTSSSMWNSRTPKRRWWYSISSTTDTGER